MISKGAVLITGASSGIGLGTAVYLAQCGFRVYATMRHLSCRKKLDAEAERCNVKLKVLQLDITDETSINNAVQSIIADSGGIYGLVNNAGILMQGFFEDLTDAEIHQAIQTNVFGTMAVTRAVLPNMRSARCGRIIIMSSTGGRITLPAVSTYCISKFALEGFGESLAQEVESLGVQVVLVEPGVVKTDLFGRNRNTAAKVLDPQGVYYRWFRQIERLTDEELKAASTSPSDVAKVIHKALTAKRPRLRYVVGGRAKLLMALQRRMPYNLFDLLWMGVIKRRVTGQFPSL